MKQSIAPSIYGLEHIKEGIMLQLFGGEPKHLPDGTRIRGDIHILLVGDPSTAKSQILLFVKNLFPKGIYLSGKGVTEVGLTASVTKSSDFGEGRYVLEAGALVLADKGIACVDELDKMRDNDKEALHSAMEQQIITIHKAGINATLKARCSVLGACNPKFGKFRRDYVGDIISQINIPETIISRFDLIFTLWDIPDKEKDEKMSEHILNLHMKGEDVKPILSPDFIKKYISYARKNIHPKITEEAKKIIKDFYNELRRDAEDTIPISPRKLESLIRLAEAYARIRLSDVATKEDAERACKLMKISMRAISGERYSFEATETGIPFGKEYKIRKLMEILQDLYKRENKPVKREDIIKEAEMEGIDVMSVDELLSLLKKKGYVIEPEKDKFMPS